jgi:hypothetical protein
LEPYQHRGARIGNWLEHLKISMAASRTGTPEASMVHAEPHSIVNACSTLAWDQAWGSCSTIHGCHSPAPWSCSWWLGSFSGAFADGVWCGDSVPRRSCARHLAWVARQEAADRQRDAERARREQQQREREREAVQHQAREIAQQIGDDLARIRRMRDAPPQPTPRPVSAVPASTTGTARRPIGKAQGVPPYGTAETTRGARRASTDRAPAGSGSPSGTSGREGGGAASARVGRPGQVRTDAELRREVYALIEVDAEGWRRWRGSKDVKSYPRFWRGRKQGGWTQAYPLIYRWEQGPMPKRWTIDHACGEKDCLDHLECGTRGENLRRRHARERGELRTGHAGLVPPR